MIQKRLLYKNTNSWETTNEITGKVQRCPFANRHEQKFKWQHQTFGNKITEGNIYTDLTEDLKERSSFRSVTPFLLSLSYPTFLHWSFDNLEFFMYIFAALTRFFLGNSSLTVSQFPKKSSWYWRQAEHWKLTEDTEQEMKVDAMHDMKGLRWEDQIWRRIRFLHVVSPGFQRAIKTFFIFLWHHMKRSKWALIEHQLKGWTAHKRLVRIADDLVKEGIHKGFAA